MRNLDPQEVFDVEAKLNKIKQDLAQLLWDYERDESAWWRKSKEALDVISSILENKLAQK